jgi:RNA polymerase sigma factor (sigma-70 family)
MSNVTRILSQIDAGDPAAAEQLLPLVYDELRRLAATRLAQEKPGQTLQATALVHEAYLRLVASGGREPPEAAQAEVGSRKSEVGSRKPDELPVSPTSDPRPPTSPAFHSRGHFFGAAAEAMRRILVEAARSKGRLKRGGDTGRIEMPAVVQAAGEDPLDLLALDEALSRLEQEHPDKAQIVKLRYFAGLNLDDTAAVAGISRATAERRWAYARAWLYRQLRDSGKDSDENS